MFVNRLTPYCKYPAPDGVNLQLPIQMQLSEKQKTFCQFLLHFWNLHQVLNILKKRIIVIPNVFPKLQFVQILVRTLSKYRRFTTRIQSQHLKASQILAKSR